MVAAPSWTSPILWISTGVVKNLRSVLGDTGIDGHDADVAEVFRVVLSLSHCLLLLNSD